MNSATTKAALQRLGRRFAVRGAGDWLSDSLSRESLLAGLRTIAWLAPLTILIWVYAEREQTDEVANQSIPIEVSTADRNLFVQLRVPDDGNVVAALSGPRGRLDEIRQRILPKGENASVVLNIDRRTPGLHDIETAQAISSSALFQSSGVTVSDANPQRLRIWVDEYDEREIEVMPPANLNLSNLVSAPVFEPSKVTIRAPRQDFAAAEQSGPIRIEADIVSSGLLERPGQHEATVRVAANKEIKNATFLPANVEATLVVQEVIDRYTVPSIVVSVEFIPHSLQAEYMVKTDINLFNVDVVGPPDQIAFLKQGGAATPTARLSITRDDTINPGVKRAVPKFDFPAGARDVTVDPAMRERYAIEYSLTKVTRPEE